MRISYRRKFIFISRPRCASTFIRSILTPYSDILSSATPPYHHHATALELEKHFIETERNWNDFFSFTTIRNPYNMMVSYYEFFKPDINGIYRYEESRDKIKYNPDDLIGFNKWIETGKTYHRYAIRKGKVIINLWVKGFSKLTLNNAIIGKSGESIVNKIIKVEDFEHSLSDVLKSLDIPMPKTLPDLNRSERQKDYRYYYNSFSKKIIEDEFAYDIELGKYKF
ncbi:MAG: hypothetical protein EOL88_00895 [Bacteroidia bacterium]|nr:hypothetical protein [Bacteroidia bacterium]